MYSLLQVDNAQLTDRAVYYCRAIAVDNKVNATAQFHIYTNNLHIKNPPPRLLFGA